MPFESQNKLVSSFNTDNVKQGLFRYRGNTSVSNIKGVSSGFVNTVSLQTNAGDIYREANEALQAVAKTATHIKTVQNQEDELRQSIDASRIFSEAYQNMQIMKEEATDSEAKQKILDSFRESTYEWTNTLTPKNKNSIESALHNFLSHEAREQAKLVRKENVVDLTNSINNMSSVLLSTDIENRKNILGNMRNTYNELGFSNEEFNEIAFSSLTNNLFAGVNSNNISREALYAIENTVNGLLNDFGELEGSKAYNATIDKINSLKSALTNRDKSYVNRAIQLNDAENFGIYNEALRNSGEITDVEYEQNILAFNNNASRVARTPKMIYENLKGLLGDELDNVALSSLKGTLITEEYEALELHRKERAIELLSQEVVDTKRLNEYYRLDPKLVEKAFGEYATNMLMNVNNTIGSLKDMKDINSEEAQNQFAMLYLMTDRFKTLADDATFVAISATANDNNKDIITMLDINSTLNNTNLSLSDKRDLLYKKINNFDTSSEIDAKVFNKVYKAVSDVMTEDFGKAYTDKMSKQVRQYIETNLGKGIDPSDVIKSAKEIYKAKKFGKNFIVDDRVSKEIGSITKEDQDLIPSFFESDRYDELLYTSLEKNINTLLDNGNISLEEYDKTITALESETQRNLASFKEDYKAMRSSGEKLTMYYDDDLKSYAITDNKSEPLRLPIPDIKELEMLFHKHRESGDYGSKGIIPSKIVNDRYWYFRNN